MKSLHALAATMGAVLLVPTVGFAQCENPYEGHFSGHSAHSSAAGTFVAGEVVQIRQTLNTTQVNPWYAFNQGAFQYTLVIRAAVTTVVNIPIGGGQFIRQVAFDNALFSAYEDAGTAADYANPATFSDGLAIFTGTITGMYAEGLVNGVAPEVLGVSGTATITGGAGQGSVLCDVLTMNDFFAWLPATSPPGYKEAYDSKWECCPTGVDASTWGGVKTLYR